jgi:hypothetical protein
MQSSGLRPEPIAQKGRRNESTGINNSDNRHARNHVRQLAREAVLGQGERHTLARLSAIAPSPLTFAEQSCSLQSPNRGQPCSRWVWKPLSTHTKT